MECCSSPPRPEWSATGRVELLLNHSAEKARSAWSKQERLCDSRPLIRRPQRLTRLSLTRRRDLPVETIARPLVCSPGSVKIAPELHWIAAQSLSRPRFACSAHSNRDWQSFPLAVLRASSRKRRPRLPNLLMRQRASRGTRLASISLILTERAPPNWRP